MELRLSPTSTTPKTWHVRRLFSSASPIQKHGSTRALPRLLVACGPNVDIRLLSRERAVGTSPEAAITRCVPSGGMVLRLFTGLENKTGSIAVLACGEGPISAITSGCSLIKVKLG